jgi:hypothetical protein
MAHLVAAVNGVQRHMLNALVIVPRLVDEGNGMFVGVNGRQHQFQLTGQHPAVHLPQQQRESRD